MNKEELLYYLADPRRLSELAYEELNDSVQTHPFCQNLRFLLAKKCQIDNRPEYEANLRKVAAYVSNRSHLYLKLNHTPNLGHKKIVLDDSKVETTTEVIDKDITVEEIQVEALNEAIAPDEAPKAVIVPPSEAKASPPTAEHKSVELRIEDKGLLTEKHLSSDLTVQQEKLEKVVFIEELVKEEPEEALTKARISIPNEESEPPVEEEAEAVAEDDFDLIPISSNSLNEVVEIIEMESPKGEQPNSVPNSSANADFDPAEEDSEEIFFEELKDNIPFEVTNHPDFTHEDIAYIRDPSPKSSFNSWFDQFKEGKKKRKKKKGKKKKLDKITEKNQLKKEKGKSAKKKKKGKKKEKAENKVEQRTFELDLPLSDAKVDKHKKKTKKKKKKGGIKSFAQKSIVENESIASETLAKLLADQGSPQKAIKMYQRLSLIFPEKSTFFAERIEKLKKK